jgi:hypothetical protein
MPMNFAHNPGVVSKLKMLTQFDARADGGGTEWFQLRSNFLNNQQLYQMLEAVWKAFVGPEFHKYALLHCKSGQHAGVWLHLLPSDKFEPGCHEVDSF